MLPRFRPGQPREAHGGGELAEAERDLGEGQVLVISPNFGSDHAKVLHLQDFPSRE